MSIEEVSVTFAPQPLTDPKTQRALNLETRSKPADGPIQDANPLLQRAQPRSPPVQKPGMEET